MADDSYFPYKPNKAAAILFAVLFGLTLLAHIYQASRKRALYMLVLIIATIMQTYGYAIRYVAIIKDPSMWALIVSMTAIIVAPAFFAAQTYMIVGRMMSYVGPESTWISHTVITKLFVIIDIACVLTQSAGTSMVSNDNNGRSSIMAGRGILIGGLIAQVASFGIFVVITIFFHRKARQLKGAELDKLEPLFRVFYLAAILITGRSIFRTIEFATIDFNNEAQGYLWDHEWPFYVLDAVPIWIATVAFNVVNPVGYLPRKKGLRMDGTVEPPRKHWWSSNTPTNASQDLLMKNQNAV
ncbi:RTA1-domain-containing protein [Serendipita vermifera]|nr:RTA1-domain-containing protein [Serendipita vermifera]